MPGSPLFSGAFQGLACTGSWFPCFPSAPCCSRTPPGTRSCTCRTRYSLFFVCRYTVNSSAFPFFEGDAAQAAGKYLFSLWFSHIVCIMKRKDDFAMVGKILKRTILCAVAVAAAGVAAYAFADFYYASHFFPGTTVNGVDAGNLTAAEVRDLLDDDLSAYTLTLSGTDTTDVIAADDIGLAYTYVQDGTGILGSALSSQSLVAAFRSQSLLSLLKGGYKNVGDGITIPFSYSNAKLAQVLETLSCLDEGQMEASQDAYLEYADGQYTVVADVTGTALDADALLETAREAIGSLEAELSLDSLYIPASVTADDENLNAQMEAANAILASDITLTARGGSVSLDADTINGFLVFGEDGDVSLDEDAISSWVSGNVSSAFNTVGEERTVVSPATGTFTISGGTYGSRVDTEGETQQLVSDLLSGEAVEREPVWSCEEWGTDNDGIGDTYIEVDISGQMVYLIGDGEVTYSTSCVTGSVADGYDTPAGVYYVSWKTRNYTMRSYDAFVYYWMPIDDSTGVGLHDATWRSEFGGSIYETNGSHGCINLPLEAAKYLYNNTDTKIPVIVH